jgi:hypothetical protein
MKNEKLIPLSQQPQYQSAISKVVDIGRALGDANDRLDQARAELNAIRRKTEAPSSGPGAIERAMAIAAGTTLANPMAPASLVEEIKRLEQEQADLKEGLLAANKAANDAAEGLSREIGLEAKPMHVATVRRVLECLEALCAANKEEEEVRAGLERLGYHRHGLEYKGIYGIGRIDDSSGSIAYYYRQQAKAYLAQSK